ncbi:MAG TPA: ParB/RepB/Spo0J family partition protein [Beijerinckiaceae bacterium]|jgi:ParB family chromosome partitioning protein
MAEEAIRPRLGRGLAALIGDVGDEMTVVERSRGQRKVPIEFLRPNPRNPRQDASAKAHDLVPSIRAKGIIQPIVVRPLPDMPDAYEIIAGERRWRAAQMVPLHEVPVVILEVDDRTSLEFAVLENVQRRDLNAIEEADGYQQLIDEFGYTQEELAQTIGKSRPHIGNMLRLRHLPDEVKAMVRENLITAGHARALLAVTETVAVAKRVVEEGLTVREVEEIGQADHADLSPAQEDAPRQRPGRPRREKDADTRAVEQALETALGLRVAIDHKGEKGELRIRYASLDQLDSLCRRLHESVARG